MKTAGRPFGGNSPFQPGTPAFQQRQMQQQRQRNAAGYAHQQQKKRREEQQRLQQLQQPQHQSYLPQADYTLPAVDRADNMAYEPDDSGGNPIPRVLAVIGLIVGGLIGLATGDLAAAGIFAIVGAVIGGLLYYVLVAAMWLFAVAVVVGLIGGAALFVLSLVNNGL